LDQLTCRTREHGGDVARNLGQQATQHPLALLLTGVGATWLMAGQGTKHEHAARVGVATSATAGTTGTAATAEAMKHKAGNAASSAKEKVAGGVRKAGERAADLKASAAEGAQWASAQTQAVKSQFETIMHEQPVVAGALGVALGAAIGALIPPTESEDRWLGKTSDSVKGEAARQAGEKYDEVRDSVATKMDEATREPNPPTTPGRA
jgi:hypothetical protein